MVYIQHQRRNGVKLKIALMILIQMKTGVDLGAPPVRNYSKIRPVISCCPYKGEGSENNRAQEQPAGMK